MKRLNQQPDPAGRRISAILTALAATLLAAAVVAVVLWQTPLRQFVNSAELAAYLAERPATLPGALVAIGAILMGTTCFIPTLAIYGAIALAFGPFWGTAISWAGTAVAGPLQFTAGRLLHRYAIKAIEPAVLTALRTRLSRSGPWPIAALRVLPVAPFVVVNLAAGALRIRIKDFALGHAAGSAVPIIAVGIIDYQLDTITQTSGLRAYAVSLFAVLAALLALRALRKALRRFKTSHNTSGM